MFRVTPFLSIAAAAWLGFFSVASGRTAAATDGRIMPLSAIEPGMLGTWRTVVAGTEIQEFNLKILGVSPNFAGPNSPVIIAEAIDASQILSGPVGGMSGSPCYINGQLIGAYAYGYLWPKEQAIIGITPIEEMLKVFDKENARPASARGGSQQTRASGAIRVEDLPRPSTWFADALAETGGLRSALQSDGPAPAPAAAAAPQSGPATGVAPFLAPAPTPLLAGGISAHTIEKFRPYAEAMGLDLMSAPVGAADGLTAADLEPGSPVGGVLLNGDFSFVAVGTCTWREGDEFLAFGHPFLQSGPVEIPVAPASVITIVRSVPRSFKLSNVGPIVGSISQDRLTAVAGRVGQAPPLTRYAVNVTDPEGVTRTYEGSLFQNERLAPFLAILGLFESTMSTLESADEQTYSITARAEYEGYEPLQWRRGGTGSSGLFMNLFRIWDVIGMVASNPFEPAELKSLTFDVQVSGKREATVLDRLQMRSGEPRPGETIDVAVGLRGFRDKHRTERIAVPIPAGTGGERLSLFIGDGQAADFIDGGSSRSVASLGELLDYLRERRDNQRLYVKLLRRSEGVRTEGRDLYDLPPSARAVLDSHRTVSDQSTIREVTLWESSLATHGPFNGSHRFAIPVVNR